MSVICCILWDWPVQSAPALQPRTCSYPTRDRRRADGRAGGHCIVRRPDNQGRAVAQTISAMHGGQPVSQQRRYHMYYGVYTKLEQPFSCGLSYLVSVRTGLVTRRSQLASDPSIAGSTPASSPRRPRPPLARAAETRVGGPGYRNLDLALLRRVPLCGARAVEVRAEVFKRRAFRGVSQCGLF
jgi:hypothetical protein